MYRGCRGGEEDCFLIGVQKAAKLRAKVIVTCLLALYHEWKPEVITDDQS